MGRQAGQTPLDPFTLSTTVILGGRSTQVNPNCPDLSALWWGQPISRRPSGVKRLLCLLSLARDPGGPCSVPSLHQNSLHPGPRLTHPRFPVSGRLGPSPGLGAASLPAGSPLQGGQHARQPEPSWSPSPRVALRCGLGEVFHSLCSQFPDLLMQNDFFSLAWQPEPRTSSSSSLSPESQVALSAHPHTQPSVSRWRPWKSDYQEPLRRKESALSQQCRGAGTRASHPRGGPPGGGHTSHDCSVRRGPR